MKEKQATKRCSKHAGPLSQKHIDGKSLVKSKVRKKSHKSKKHPLAPKKPRSAFILFSQHMHNVKGDKCKEMNQKVPRAAQHISAVWKSMSLEERKTWKTKAENDNRYKVELAMYSGPLTLPNFDKNGTKKDPSAPKRPMSAYLDYSKTFRGQVILDNPHVTDNKEISKILGMMWNNASDNVKRPFVVRELALRAKYNEDIAKWRKERDDRLAAERSHREYILQRAIETGTGDQLIRDAEASRASLAVQLHYKTNPHECTSSLRYHPSYANNCHGSEEISAQAFSRRPFNTEARQQYNNASCFLEPMLASENGRKEFPPYFRCPENTGYQQHLDSDRCSGYGASGSSCCQEMSQYSNNSYFYSEGFDCRESSLTSFVDHSAYHEPLNVDLSLQLSQPEQYPWRDRHGSNYRKRQGYHNTRIFLNHINFPCEALLIMPTTISHQG